MSDQRLRIPQVETLLQEPTIQHWFALLSRPITVDQVRKVLEQVRSDWASCKSMPTRGEIVAMIEASCENRYLRRPRRVINCTGVIGHTNLGRAPVSIDVWNDAAPENTGYCSIELDLVSGKRGERNALVSDLLSQATEAESAIVVNNNAAAIFLTLSVFAKRKEVIVSRGELVQIGGGFRIPDILRQSGAKLVEVGTTNITTIEDYVEAVTERTAMVLKVHRSNFALRGFSSEPNTRELSAALPPHVLLVVDQGSGVLDDGRPGETSVASHVSQGAHVVTFSADKALGSVQAGCIAGSAMLMAKLRRSPLYRVLRPGKTVLTLLEHSMVRRLNGELPPVLRLYDRSVEELRLLGEQIIEALPEHSCTLVEAPMTLGGGSCPDEQVPGIAIRLNMKASPERLLSSLRAMDVPIIGTIEHKAVNLNLGAVSAQDVPLIIESLRKLLEA